MLYISRFAGEDVYGVVDTDDDIENIVSWQELCEAVETHGLDIQGTVLANTKNTILMSCRPYQLPKYCTKAQAKLKTISKVDLKLWRGEVTSVIFDNEIVEQDITLRLSDYGRRISGAAPIGGTFFMLNCGPTIILDDKVEVYGDSLEIFMSGVRWDLREMRDTEFIYKYMVARHKDRDYWKYNLIDLPGRGPQL